MIQLIDYESLVAIFTYIKPTVMYMYNTQIFLNKYILYYYSDSANNSLFYPESATTTKSIIPVVILNVTSVIAWSLFITPYHSADSNRIPLGMLIPILV